MIIDIGAGFNGYWGDLTRTWICGNVKPTEEMKDWHQKCYDALFNAGGAVKPGATNADVFAQADPYVLDSPGHGAGGNPWAAPHFSPASKDSPVVLQEGMVFNLEPYAGKPGVGGFRLENDHIVTRRRGHLHHLSVRRAPGEGASPARSDHRSHEVSAGANALPSFRLDDCTGSSPGRATESAGCSPSPFRRRRQGRAVQPPPRPARRGCRRDRLRPAARRRSSPAT